ncbi:ammonium transporter [Enterovibrio sp. ZSDZ35]|uniref:Ammonium transporter n=1 Tax=Enterovibrio qingdaonensis TaxID=2899818 RepID=A0ABT5QH91_9GAMM|nr:ammonium transporter [Enterovibrio sp. ZSDZ35]MDD1780338.1 ammonium transporter [Enterovibrio sp. ZSDZ35]
MESIQLQGELLDTVWLMLCTALVLLMQPGFTCFESGLVRSKNNINVALKNVADFCVAGVSYWVVGFGLMYGSSINGFIGFDNFFFEVNGEHFLLSFFLFQLMFCGTATTIVAGAVAERMRFSGYLICSLLIASVIFPISGHWIWSGLHFSTNDPGWLREIGFIDFAGGTVVHSVGGWLALAGIIILGPRLGRFNEAGKVQDIFGQNLPLSALGTFLLFFGWFGFNGGSLITPNEKLPLVFANTALAACFGGVAALIFSWHLHSMRGIRYCLNGLLAGLVSITASANILSPHMAALVGFVGGIVSVLISHLLLQKQLDDVVDAVPVHLGGGIWGTLAVAIVGPLSAFEGATRSEQLLTQIVGVLACGVWAFGLGYLALTLINRLYPLRVSPQTETIGLNYGEHGLKDELIELMQQVDDMREQKNFERTISFDRGSESAAISIAYNHLLEAVNQEYRDREENLLRMANLDPLTGIANRRMFDNEYDNEWQRNQREGTGLGLMLIDVDNFKKYNDRYGHTLGDYCLQNICKALSDGLLRSSDTLARFGGEEFAVIIPNTTPSSLQHLAERLRNSVEQLNIPHAESELNIVTVSIGLSYVSTATTSNKSAFFDEADKALYQAKHDGRNRVAVFREIRSTG